MFPDRPRRFCLLLSVPSAPSSTPSLRLATRFGGALSRTLPSFTPSSPLTPFGGALPAWAVRAARRAPPSTPITMSSLPAAARA
eukprot:5768906-Alexandrium_andersonii.AAC.1